MEILDCILKWLASFSVIFCSLCWIACSWLCIKTSQSVSERVKLCEKLALSIAERLARMEYKELISKIEGEKVE